MQHQLIFPVTDAQRISPLTQSREPQKPTVSRQFTYLEFFSGGGMARLGLGRNWRCVFSNDFDLKKAAVYQAYWHDDALKVEDIRRLSTSDLPSSATMAWASFPCQDLSLAGMGAGLRGDRSGTFWPFWKLMEGLHREDRAPKLLVLENVCGTITSHKGRDFTAIATALSHRYQFGAVVINASRFVPQSRPRLFIVAVDKAVILPNHLVSNGPSPLWHTKPLIRAQANLPFECLSKWVWWNLPKPRVRTSQLADIVEAQVEANKWHSLEETTRLLSMMGSRHREKISAAREAGIVLYGTAYKRTRMDEQGLKVQRAEVRFDGIAGCLRTSSGGSSRQVVIEVNGTNIRSRLITIGEAARLMGLPRSYPLPANYNEAYHLLGDGLVVPVVEFLRKNLLDPLALASCREELSTQ